MNGETVHLALWVGGVLSAFVWGRLFCGKICLFGLLQRVFYKIPFPVKFKSFKADKYLRGIKYILLIVIILFSTVFASASNHADNANGSPMVTLIILVILCFLSILFERPFCKYFCYFGLILSLGNKVSLFTYRIDGKKCIQCGICAKNCVMDIIPYKPPNNLECVRCGRCIKVCPYKAITFKARGKKHGTVKE